MKKNQTHKQKTITVAIAGPTNAGKSTLVNYLIEQKISIVSPKVQTTRNIIRGIFIQDDTQVILIDTPGIFIPDKKRFLERKIVKSAWQGIAETDIVCLVIDVTKGFNSVVKTLINDLSKKELQLILVLNKVDEIKQKVKLLELAKQITDYYSNFKEVFMISATTGHGIENFKKYLTELAPESPWLYDEDEITDAPLKFLASEITREKLFLHLKQELPYSIKVETEEWEQFKNGDIKIKQAIYVLKEKQKSIVLGNKGSLIREISIQARQEIQKFTNSKVHLFLFVKVQSDWIEKDN